MEVDGEASVRPGIKRVKLGSSSQAPIYLSLSSGDEDDRDLKRKTPALKCSFEWLADPLDEGLLAAVLRDVDEQVDDIDADHWVDDDPEIFGEKLVTNPYEELQVEDIHKRGLPNASYVKATSIVDSIDDNEGSHE